MSLFSGRRDEDAAEPLAHPATSAEPEATRATGTTPGSRGEAKMANIGKSISIKGDLTGNEDMVIEGKVEGKVELPNAQLTIGANGTVRAEVNAKSVVVIGRVTGNLNGTERVEIQATGVVDGDVNAPRLIVAEGAVVNGTIHMTKAGATSTRPQAGSEEIRKAGSAA